MENAAFRFRLIHLDQVMVDAGPFDRTETAFSTTPLIKVPVLRVFGATPAGQRVCAHLHGAFPYCYIEYKGRLERDVVQRYISRLGQELNAAIAASLSRNPFKDKGHFVHAIQLVKGIPFYGYHVGWRYFLKISFTDPSLNARLHTILESGRVMQMRFQPFEIHIRYQLQFMLDYNVFGCDYIDLEEYHFRRPLPAGDVFSSQTSANADVSQKLWCEGNIPSEMVCDEPRISHCAVEIDASVSAILNRRKLKGRNVHHVFDEVDTLAGDAKFVPSLTSLWEEESRRRMKAGLSATIPKSVEGGRSEHPRWQAHDRLWKFVEARIQEEGKGRKESPSKQHFTRSHPEEASIVTAFDSVDVSSVSPAEMQAESMFGQEAMSQEDLHYFQSQAFLEQVEQREEEESEPEEEEEVAGPETPRKNSPQKVRISPVKATPLNSTQLKRPAEFNSTQAPKRVRVARTGNAYQYAYLAPTRDEVMDSFAEFNLAREEHPAPFFSNPNDVPPRREYAGRSFTFSSVTLPYLQEFDHYTREEIVLAKLPGRPRMRHWEYAETPPSRDEVTSWLVHERALDIEAKKRRRKRLASQIEKMTQQLSSSFGFKGSPGQPSPDREKQHMTTLSIEVFARSRRNLLPDPEFDSIEAIAYSLQNEDETLEDNGSRPGLFTGVIIHAREDVDPHRLGLSYNVQEVDSEEEVFTCLAALVRKFDPEILVGYEIHNGSWGYVIERGAQLGMDMVFELGRVIEGSTGAAKGKDDRWGYTQTSALRVTGRHVLNIWRLMRGEIALTQYTYENVVFHTLHRRVPKFSPATLTEWYSSTATPERIARVINYLVAHAETNLEILDSSELIFRTSEFARIYGIDFFSVLSRGSQFKVESVMFRIAKPESFLLPSPSVQQVASQNAAECIPLIMEPQSAFFKGPLVVVDFQSLYPSIMIAYNICYSTCLGRVADFKGTQKFGFSELHLPKGLLTLLKDDIHVSPNGMIYVKPQIRRSLLAKMLTEILDTRVMVKGSMKGVKEDRFFLRMQNARQLSLKLLANVTYGYTSATFSGRMPCVELADSIVQYGRETLERAIQLIESEDKWGAKVVYGDTDSLFIYLEGRTKDDAFRIGQDIADAVTSQNPKPVKLKFEKVYLPSVLLAKKRYVGYKFEHPDDEVPTFDAKGIETVRRDGNAALQRIQEACIRILFRTRDLSQVKAFLQRQWQKILEGRVNIQDFIIAKEVRLGTYSDKGPPPPGAAVASRKMMLDPRAEPQHAERVPYLISQGEPKAKLNDQAVSPEVMLANPSLRLNALYYIERSIMQPLARIFNLLGADVERWFREMPRPKSVPQGRLHLQEESTRGHRFTLAEHYRSEQCILCGEPTEKTICLDCRLRPQETVATGASKLHLAQERVQAVTRICASCSSLPHAEDSPCVSIDCPMLFVKSKNSVELDNSLAVLNHLEDKLMSPSHALDRSWTQDL